jgi:hypothetical protein
VAKAQAIIERAYALIGVKALGEPLDGDTLQYGLDALNSLIDSWQAESLFIPYTTEFSQTVTGSPITIGAGQTLNTPRPKFIRDTSFVRFSNTDYPLAWLDQSDFNQITNKSISSTYPLYGYYDGKYPTANIYLYPTASSTDLHLIFDAVLPAFADYTTDVNIDTGWLRALQYSLAEELAPGLIDISPQLAKSAASARRVIRTNNAVVPTLNLDIDLPGQRNNLWSHWT